MEVIQVNLKASTWHELETNGKFGKMKKLSFLVKDGNFGMPYLPEKLYGELRRLSMFRELHEYYTT